MENLVESSMIRKHDINNSYDLDFLIQMQGRVYHDLGYYTDGNDKALWANDLISHMQLAKGYYTVLPKKARLLSLIKLINNYERKIYGYGENHNVFENFSLTYEPHLVFRYSKGKYFYKIYGCFSQDLTYLLNAEEFNYNQDTNTVVDNVKPLIFIEKLERYLKSYGHEYAEKILKERYITEKLRLNIAEGLLKDLHYVDRDTGNAIPYRLVDRNFYKIYFDIVSVITNKNLIEQMDSIKTYKRK